MSRHQGHNVTYAQMQGENSKRLLVGCIMETGYNILNGRRVAHHFLVQ